MSREQLSIPELLLSLDSSELQEAEQVRAAVNQQLSSDRGGAVLCSLVDHYVDSLSPQALLLLSSVREPHHKTLLDKLNEVLTRPATRLNAVTLLGHLVRREPPWVHHVSRSALLPNLLRCLKTDADVVVLITGVLVLITLLPMIPHAAKQHIYDFFDVFGRLASWSLKNPGHVQVVHLVHLQASVYSLFHRLYGMFPCNFISYLRLHYSMKENLDTFQEVVKPMLEHVRVHPELVTGTPDYELDPSRWRCYEVHDIVIECSRVSLDPLESSWEDTVSSASSSLDVTCGPHTSDTGSSVCPVTAGRHVPLLPPLVHNSSTQAADVTWSPSFRCGMSTPPPETSSSSSTHSLSRTISVSGVKGPPPTSAHVTDGSQDGGQMKQQPITELQSTNQPILEGHQGDVINNNNNSGDVKTAESQQPSSSSSQPVLLTSTPRRVDTSPGSDFSSLCSSSPCSTPSHSLRPDEGVSNPFAPSPAPSYDSLFELALPQAAMLLLRTKTQEALNIAEGQLEKGVGQGEDVEAGPASAVSPLEMLDQLIVNGHIAHERLSRRSSAVSKSADRSHFGGKQQSMRSKGPAGGEELQALRSQLLLMHSQLLYERFKRQQHAMRNRRLLRRVISATALEEQSVAMRAQLGVQDEEIRCLKTSLEEEQRRYTELRRDTHTHTTQLHTHIQQLLAEQQDNQRDAQRLQSELQECQRRLRDLEAELQRANNKAYNAEHQLTELSVKLSSSEQLQQQIFLLNQQLVLMRETNRTLMEQLEAGDGSSITEVSMLQSVLGRENQRLQEADAQQRQKLEAANHRAAELEDQLAKKEQLLVDLKNVLDDAKTQSRIELTACESRYIALRRVTQTLQTEMLQLYSQIHQDMQAATHHSHSRPQDVRSRPNSSSAALPVAPGSHRPRPSSSSSVSFLNGSVEPLSMSPLHLLPSVSSSPLSLSPIESPLAVGSFLEQRARELFRSTNHSQDEAEQQEEEEEEEEEGHEEEEEEAAEARRGSPSQGQEVEEAILLAGSPPVEPLLRVPAAGAPASEAPEAPDLTLAVRQRRRELSIMDYDELLPEF